MAATHCVSLLARYQVFVAIHAEHYPMREVNAAMAHLRAGKARYRIVLDADFD